MESHYNNVMKKFELTKIGVPNSSLDLAVEFCSAAAKSGLLQRYKMKELVEMVVTDPKKWIHDSIASRFANSLIADSIKVNNGTVDLKIWGENGIDINAIEQMRNSCSLPIAYKGALMADAHYGYGLPIGGVLATINSVVPFCVGVDIACRMKISLLDLDVNKLVDEEDKFINAIESQTAFGKACEFKKKRQHQVMDKDWTISPITKQMKNTAWSQLGTSGGGNHFVEWGIVEFVQDHGEAEAGKKYIALLSHSGSRGTGAKVCSYYHKIAQSSLSKSDQSWRYLAWLSLDTQEGKEYWDAMNLMGDYAAANHDCIHRHVIEALGTSPFMQIENHHNFAWKEIHDGMEVIVHRKGATPAGKDVLGVIPGSMADPAYIVRGLGNQDSLMSASHGAGRKHSRSHAKQSFSWEHWNKEIKNRGVKLLGAGIDEVPGVYKDINQVMQCQTDLVEPIARFNPKIVKMAGEGEAED